MAKTDSCGLMAHLETQQTAWGNIGRELISVDMPCQYTELMPGICWGHTTELFTPAFWKYHSLMQRAQNRYLNHRLGRSLTEEVAVCVLGGYGMPAELGLAAFERLRDLQLIDGTASAYALEEQLAIPFTVSGRKRRYRFPKQKARYLSSALKEIRAEQHPKTSVALRDFLTTLNGVGPKTASWVVRNYLAANDVAILDIHIIRAGVEIGLFDPNADPNRHYFALERRFLDFCLAIGEPASIVDAIMWDYMRRIWRKAPSNTSTTR